MAVELPTSAGRLARRAPEMGWSVEILSASGQWRGKEIDLVCVWLERNDLNAVAQWVDGKADSCWVWPWPQSPGFHKLGYRELMTYLAENGA